MNPKELTDLIIKGMQEKKAHDITVLDLQNVKNAVADYFILCTANSDTQADAIADSIEKEVFVSGKENAWQKEGKQNREWILIDYVSVVAHVFNKSKRSHYDLENLWGDAKITLVTEEN
jgi:ribosome-associated protein